MKENVLDVLLYLFENYMYDEPEIERDRESLQAGLIQAGFSATEIDKAFNWLDELARQGPPIEMIDRQPGPVRIYAEQESARLDVECRDFLIALENAGVLDGSRRELVIERVMALDLDEVELDDLKWVILMVLFNQPGQEAAYVWMENLMFEDLDEELH